MITAIVLGLWFVGMPVLAVKCLYDFDEVVKTLSGAMGSFIHMPGYPPNGRMR